MGVQLLPGGDELRARAHLRALHVRPFGYSHDAPQRTPMTTPTPDEDPRWWSVGKRPADEPPQEQGSGLPPGVHVHITPQPQPAPVDTRALERRGRAQRWLLVHAAAAGAGWTFGLYDAITVGLHAAQHGGTAMGLALAGLAYAAAEFAMGRYGRLVPRRLRPAAAWILRIPFATALLATALYAPNALP